MPRIRTIKPALWEDISDLSHEARLLFIGLISMVDDDGRFIASPVSIAGYVYPHDDIPQAKVRNWLAEIANSERLVLYEVNGNRYGWLPNFRKHQRISHPQDSTLPPPPFHMCVRNGSTVERGEALQHSGEPFHAHV